MCVASRVKHCVPMVTVSCVSMGSPWFAAAAPGTVLVLGDSLSAGFGLPPEQGWVRLLDVRGDMTLASIIAREAANGGDLEDVYRAFYLGLACELVRAA